MATKTGSADYADYREAGRAPPAETRVLYEVLDDQVVVAVFRVAHRREAYRD